MAASSSRSGDARTWLALRRGADARWRFTLDEKPVLDALTKGWRTTPVGNIVYHSRKPLTTGQRDEAGRMALATPRPAPWAEVSRRVFADDILQGRAATVAA
jgi:hypothetical protein